MILFLKNLLTGNFASPSGAGVEISCSDFEGLSIETLWNDFERRTSHYDRAQLTLSQRNPRLLNWIGSIDYSGHTRQKCLSSLIANFVAGDENRILLRLADWVPQVRQQARDWILEFFGSLPLGSMAANQHLLLYLSRKEQLRNDPAMQEINKVLLERTNSMAASVFLDFTAMFRRFLFSQFFSKVENLRVWMLNDPEPFGRLLLLEKLGFSALTTAEIARFTADRSVFVRRRFLRVRLEAGDIPSKSDLLSLALDSNRSLRELGQYYLRELYDEDAYSIYKAKSGEEYFYIADYCRKEDSEEFIAGVKTGSKTTQYNCLKALVSEAPSRLVELNLKGLLSQNRKIRATLLPLLPRLLTIDSILDLRPVLQASSRNGVLSFLMMLERKSFWRFVDEGLGILMTDTTLVVHDRITQTILGKREIHEPLSADLRNSISEKVAELRADSEMRHARLLDVIEFTMKSA